jgi:hypothetical protein
MVNSLGQSQVLQTALELAQQWFEGTEFSINQSKTTIVPFTNKRVLQGLKELFGKTFQLSTVVKYLGLMWDMGLTWRHS